MMITQHLPHFSTRAKYFIIIVILVLCAIRIILPYAALKYTINEINKIPEYSVKISDLNLTIIQGKSTLKNIELWKKNAEISVPFFKADAITYSLQWAALLKGKLVAKVQVESPKIYFVTDPQKNNQQLGISKQGIEILKSLMPLSINQVIVHNGSVYFKNFHGDPPFSIYLKNMDVKMTNMQNAKRLKDNLISRFSLKAIAMDNGELMIDGRFNPLIQTPTFYVKASLNSLKLPELNPFLKHYTDIKAQSGEFSFFMEAAAAKGKINGYAKPFIKDFKAAEEEKNIPQKIYAGAVTAVAKILENKKQKSIATQINITGDVDDPDVSIFSLISYLLRHSFIQALLPQIDNKVSMEDVTFPSIKR